MSPAPQQDFNSAATALSPHGSLGPPPSRPLTKRRPHRRSPQACDECRLRKRACDAVEPCRPCQRGGLKCTYQFRRPVPPPTLRIRNLQDHLSLARTWLQHVKDHAPDVPGLDLDECLRTLDFTQPNPHDPASPSTNAPTPVKSPSSAASTPAKAVIEQTPSSISPLSRHKPGNMMAGCNRIATLHSGETCFYGAFSDLSFALRTIELFRQGRDPDEQRSLESLQWIFAKPLEAKGIDLHAQSPFPDEQQLSLLDQNFETKNLMFLFLPIERLQDAAANPSPPPDIVPLLHFWLALQFLTNYRKHRTQTCQPSWDRAYFHMKEGMSCLVPYCHDSLASLQAYLCAANVMLLMGRINTAHSLISTATSMALRLGLLVKGIPIHPDPERRTERIKAMSTLLALDMLLSLILDLQPFVSRDVIDEAALTALAQSFESDRDLQTAAMLRQVCLLLVPTSIRELAMRGSATSAEAESDAVMEDIRLLEKAHSGFRRWKRDVSPLMTALGPSIEDRIITKDLEMLYNFCQIIIFRSHLHHLRSVAVGGSMSKAQSYHALACLKIATLTIGHIDRLTDSTQIINLANSWLGMYTIFSAVMCLIFLIAAHPGTAYPSVAWQRAYRGIRVLAVCSCGSNIAAACLEAIKVVTTELSHTVYFDYQEIETTIKRICDGADSKESSTRPSPSISSETGNGFMDNPADRMLFQADTLKAEFDFGDILHLSESE